MAPRDAEYDRKIGYDRSKDVPKPNPAMFLSKEERDRESGGRSTSTSIATPAGSTSTVTSTSSTAVTDNTPIGSPGKAWKWDGSKWVHATDKPADGKAYDWDNDTGWVLRTVQAPATVHPAKGSKLSTIRGSQYGFRRDVLADGAGGIYYSDDIADAGAEYAAPANQPGSTGQFVGGTPERNLAENTFANTFALLWGTEEAAQPYVKKLYAMANAFYKTGSTESESMNLALHEAHNNNAIPEFTSRFSGIFELKAKNLKGGAFTIPTMAEYIEGQNDMGEILRSSGMGDLATKEYTSKIIGFGKSVKDVADALNISFNAIDNAPQDVKETLSKRFSMLDRVTLAKSLLMGPDGPAAIQKIIDSATSVTAVAKQGVKGLSDNQMDVLTNSGLSYAQQSEGLKNVKNEGARGQELSNVFAGQADGFGQNEAFQDEFQRLASAERKKKQIEALERAGFGGSSGGLKDSYGTPRSSYGKSSAGQI